MIVLTSFTQSKVLELSFATLSLLHLNVLVYLWFFRRIIPFPLQIHCLSLLFCHQAHLIILVADHCPLFIFSSIHNSVYWVVNLSSFEFCLGTIKVESIFELDGSFPAMLGWKATSKNTVSLSICLRLFRIVGKKIMNIDIFDLMKLKKFYDLVSLCLETFKLNFFRSQHKLSSKSPSGSFWRSVDQFVRSRVLSFITTH